MRKPKKTTAAFGRPVELPGALGELARLVGGTSELATLMGVTNRTIQRWGAGSFVPPGARSLLRRLAADHGLSAAKQKELAELGD